MLIYFYGTRFEHQKRKGAIKIAVTTNEILIPKRSFSPKTEKELELDTSLPEYCPDIARIIKVDCTPFCESCEISESGATVKGRAVYDLLYESEGKSRLRYASFTQEFSHSLPLARNGTKASAVFCKINCERIGCRLLSPRRPMIKATLGTQLEFETETVVKALAVNEDGETFFRKKTIGFDGFTKQCTATQRFTETLSLAQSEKSIGRIICGGISLQSMQAALSHGRAEIRGSAVVTVLCEEESNEGKYFATAKTLPVNLEINDESIEDHKQFRADFSVTESEFTPELDQYGESRNINTSFSLKASLRISEPKAYTVAEDMFEKGYDSVPTVSKASLPHLHSMTENGFSAEIKLPPAEPKPESLLDSGARSTSPSVSKAEGGIQIEGSFIINLLADTAQGIRSYDHVLPYSQIIMQDIPKNESQTLAEVVPIEVIPTLHADGGVTVRVIATARISVYTETEESFITEITKRTVRERSEGKSELVFCYPQKGEDLWSIAKLYRTDPETIQGANPESFDESGISIENASPILIKM